MSVARPVRVARDGTAGRTRVVRVAPPRPVEAPTGPPGPVEERENHGASLRAWRLSLAYAVGIGAVFAALALSARLGPAGGGPGTLLEVEIAGLLAAALIAVGVVVALGAAPRCVQLGPSETVVVGRFGHRYRFPALDRLQVTVLQRHPKDLFSPVPLESVEIGGGSTRRAFLIDAGLLGPSGGAEPDPAVAPA